MEFEEWKEASDYYKEEQEAIKAKRFRKSRIPTMETGDCDHLVQAACDVTLHKYYKELAETQDNLLNEVIYDLECLPCKKHPEQEITKELLLEKARQILDKLKQHKRG